MSRSETDIEGQKERHRELKREKEIEREGGDLVLFVDDISPCVPVSWLSSINNC